MLYFKHITIITIITTIFVSKKSKKMFPNGKKKPPAFLPRATRDFAGVSLVYSPPTNGKPLVLSSGFHSS